MQRIGDRIYRDSGNCYCKTCKDNIKNGLIVRNEEHAEYLSQIDSEFAACGTYLNYRDKKQCS